MLELLTSRSPHSVDVEHTDAWSGGECPRPARLTTLWGCDLWGRRHAPSDHALLQNGGSHCEPSRRVADIQSY